MTRLSSVIVPKRFFNKPYVLLYIDPGRDLDAGMSHQLRHGIDIQSMFVVVQPASIGVTGRAHAKPGSPDTCFSAPSEMDRRYFFSKWWASWDGPSCSRSRFVPDPFMDALLFSSGLHITLYDRGRLPRRSSVWGNGNGALGSFALRLVQAQNSVWKPQTGLFTGYGR